MSPLGQLLDERAPSLRDKAARANWRARNWRARQGKKLQREQQRLELAAARGLIDWANVRIMPAEKPEPPPARECQWIDHAGRFCGAPSMPGRSWCAAHAAIVFARTEATD